MHKFHLIILARAYERPQWAKSFYKIKGFLTQLVDQGYLERIAPPNGEKQRGKNMLQLTDKGIDYIERHWEKQKAKK